VIRWLFLVAILGVVCNLFVIQVLHHDEYVEKARAAHMRKFTIAAKRGLIYMRDRDESVPIVMNRQVWTVFLDVMEVRNEEKVRKALKEVLSVSDETLDKAFADKSSRYYVVAKSVGREQAEKLKEKELSGVGMSERTDRAYVEGAMAAQTLGFVNADGEGQYGVEQGFNARLAGKEGYMHTVTDVNNIPLSLGDENIAVPAEDGEDVYLTMERNIQRATEKLLLAGMERAGAEWGSVMVMEAKTSRVVAMANAPSFDPSNIGAVQDYRVLSNPILTDPYEPGSVVKTFSFSAGLDAGKIQTSTPFNNGDGRCTQVDGQRICNLETKWSGTITMERAFIQSLNTGMTQMLRFMGSGGDKITYAGRQLLYDYYYNKFRFGQNSGLGVYEVPGILISPDDGEGGAFRYANMSFGQGMTANIMQISTAFSAVVNGGVYRKPALEMKDVEKGNRVISEEVSKTMRRVLAETWKSTNSRNLRPYVAIGGKTGTAQVPDGMGGYKEVETLGSFVGFVGDTVDEPKYVIMVRLGAEDKEIRGWDHAGYLFNDIVDFVVQYDGMGVR